MPLLLLMIKSWKICSSTPWKISFWFGLSFNAINRLFFYWKQSRMHIGTFTNLFLGAKLYSNVLSHMHVYARAWMIHICCTDTTCSEIIWHFAIHGLFNSEWLILMRYFNLEYIYTSRFVFAMSAWYMPYRSKKHSSNWLDRKNMFDFLCLSCYVFIVLRN